MSIVRWVVAAAIVIAAVVVLWRRCSTDNKSTTSKTTEAPARSATIESRPSARGTEPLPQPQPSPTPAPIDPDAPRAQVAIDREPPEIHPRHVDTTPAVIARLEEVRTKLRELAKPCAANAGASDKFVQVRYSIAIESGQARTVEVSRFGGTLNDPAIESCIVDAIRNARWTMAGPDEVIPIADQIKMSELAR